MNIEKVKKVILAVILVLTAVYISFNEYNYLILLEEHKTLLIKYNNLSIKCVECTYDVDYCLNEFSMFVNTCQDMINTTMENCKHETFDC
jgi:hypothetical protein